MGEGHGEGEGGAEAWVRARVKARVGRGVGQGEGRGLTPKCASFRRSEPARSTNWNREVRMVLVAWWGGRGLGARGKWSVSFVGFGFVTIVLLLLFFF